MKEDPPHNKNSDPNKLVLAGSNGSMTALNLGIYNVAPFWNKIDNLWDSSFAFPLVKLVWGPKDQNFENYPWFHDFSHFGVCRQQFSAKDHLWLAGWLAQGHKDKLGGIFKFKQVTVLWIAVRQSPSLRPVASKASSERLLSLAWKMLEETLKPSHFVTTMWNMRVFQEVALLGTHLERDRILSPSAWHRSDSYQSS